MALKERRARIPSAVCVLAGACAAVCVTAVAQEAEQEFVRMTAPVAGREIVAKKPAIRVAFEVPIDPATVHVLLDGMDVTSLVERTDGGLAFAPRHVLPGGEHVLQVQARTLDGLDLLREFHFGTRHSPAFTELASRLQMGLEAEGLAARRDVPQSDPSYRSQGEIQYRLQAARNDWDSSFESNLWYLNQKLEVFPPQHEGLELASYRLHAGARGETYGLSADIGDVQILGSNRTLGSLARRGATLGFDYRNLAFGGFAVNSQQAFGFRGGSGIGTDPDMNVYGFSTGIGFFDERLRLRALHARGGEPGSSFGLFTAQGSTRGRVTGYVLNARPLPSIELEAEYDQSDFDANANDDVASRGDEAYALRVAGQKNAFNFQLAYEHLGPGYAVVASPVQRDQENVAASGGFQLAKHSVSATALHQQDNVDEDPERSRLANREWALDYNYVASERWLLGAGYRDSRVASSREPAGFSAQEVLTSALTGRAQLSRHPWYVGFELALSDQDDRFIDANDSKVETRTFSPSYQTERLSITPLFATNTTTFRSTGVELEQRNVSLMLNGQLAEQRFGYGLTFAYYDQDSSDDSLDADTRSAELRLSYRMRRLHEQGARATFNVRTTYLQRRDRIFAADTKDWTVWLTVNVNPQFAF